jgi:hypothetical protein
MAGRVEEKKQQRRKHGNIALKNLSTNVPQQNGVPRIHVIGRISTARVASFGLPGSCCAAGYVILCKTSVGKNYQQSGPYLRSQKLLQQNQNPTTLKSIKQSLILFQTRLVKTPIQNGVPPELSQWFLRHP